MCPARAETELAAILAPMDQRGTADSLGSFVSEVDLPLFRQKWKSSTARTNEERIHCHLAIIKNRPLRLLRREDLQRLLNEKACGRSVVQRYQPSQVGLEADLRSGYG